VRAVKRYIDKILNAIWQAYVGKIIGTCSLCKGHVVIRFGILVPVVGKIECSDCGAVLSSRAFAQIIEMTKRNTDNSKPHACSHDEDTEGDKNAE